MLRDVKDFLDQGDKDAAIIKLLEEFEELQDRVKELEDRRVCSQC